jgi:hypothetical protein
VSDFDLNDDFKCLYNGELAERNGDLPIFKTLINELNNMLQKEKWALQGHYQSNIHSPSTSMT